jgi:hypothetical protein
MPGSLTCKNSFAFCYELLGVLYELTAIEPGHLPIYVRLTGRRTLRYALFPTSP